MKFTRNYLKSDELEYIVNEIIKQESAVLREILKKALVMQILITKKELGKFEHCNDLYNKSLENNLDFNEIINYSDIDRLVKEELGIDKLLKDFLIGFEEKLDESVKNLDLNSAVEKLSEIANKDMGDLFG